MVNSACLISAAPAEHESTRVEAAPVKEASDSRILPQQRLKEAEGIKSRLEQNGSF